MNPQRFFVVIAILVLGPGAAADDRTWKSSRRELLFVEAGDRTEPARYVVRGRSRTIFFDRSGITVVLGQGVNRWAIRQNFVGARRTEPVATGLAETRISYFRGPEAKWRRGLRCYRKLTYANMWPGIDVVYEARKVGIKSTFIVRAGADPSRIAVMCDGTTDLQIDERGGLRIVTPLGLIEEAAPVAFQEGAPVSVKFEIDRAASLWRFGLQAYDRSRTLVIDPITPVISGFLGGALDDEVLAVAVDRNGCIYVAGSTGSSEASFPVRVGPDLTYGGQGDAFVAKISADGRRLLYCGYLGGTRFDDGCGIAVDTGGHAYVVGAAGTGFPVKVGPTLVRQGQDAFISKLTADGTDLIYSGFIGGADLDEAQGVAIDGSGCAYVTGRTRSLETSFPVKIGPDLTQNDNGTAWDAFVAKVNPSGSALVYAGYIGGATDDEPQGIAVDSSGAAYVCGWTAGSGFPTKVGPNVTHSGGLWDGFVTKVAPSGRQLDYSGFIGGAAGDFCTAIAVDAVGRAHVVGTTSSDERSFPISVGPDLSYAGFVDGFIARIGSDGAGLEYCGYVGGNLGEIALGVAVDGRGAAVVVGQTGSAGPSFPVQIGPALAPSGGGDVFVSSVAPDGKGFDWSGFFGGARADKAHAVTVDQAGSVYVVGVTESDRTSFPTTMGPMLESQGGKDGFVAKFSVTLINAIDPPRVGTTMRYSLTASDDAGRAYQVGSSFGSGPIAVDTRSISLSSDPLLWTSVSGLLPTMFASYRGTIGTGGRASASLTVPNIPAAVGTRVHTAFVTLDPAAPSGIRTISDPETVVLLR